jgi:putative flippase GtrA
MSVALMSIAIQWLFVRGAEAATGYNHTALWVAYVLGVGVGLLFTYSGYYFWVWRKEK